MLNAMPLSRLGTPSLALRRSTPVPMFLPLESMTFGSLCSDWPLKEPPFREERSRQLDGTGSLFCVLGLVFEGFWRNGAGCGRMGEISWKEHWIEDLLSVSSSNWEVWRGFMVGGPLDEHLMDLWPRSILESSLVEKCKITVSLL